MPRRLSVVALLVAGAACAGSKSGGEQAVGRAPDPPALFKLGRAASDSEIAKWNTDVGPDGAGLPAGQGTVAQGAPIYAMKCAGCHGVNGSEGPNDVLVETALRDSFPFWKNAALGSKQSIGNYWPYATTLYDYIARAMPFDKPGSLQPAEVYALVAFLLNRNGIIADTVVIDARSLPGIQMPAKARYVVDDRKGGAEVR
jgi:S-disulfanyl-L-cysteine oxidoreductase SoxD